MVGKGSRWPELQVCAREREEGYIAQRELGCLCCRGAKGMGGGSPHSAHAWNRESWAAHEACVARVRSRRSCANHAVCMCGWEKRDVLGCPYSGGDPGRERVPIHQAAVTCVLCSPQDCVAHTAAQKLNSPQVED